MRLGGQRNTQATGQSRGVSTPRVGPLHEHTATDEVSLDVLQGTITCRVLPALNPLGGNTEAIAREFDAAMAAEDTDRAIEAADAARTVEVRFAEALMRQVAQEDTALCCGTGEFAMRVANALLNARDPAEAKLCLTAYRPAAFMQRSVDNTGLHTVAREKFLAELIENAKGVRPARLAWTPGELSEFAVQVSQGPEGNPHAQLCFVTADGRCVGLFDASTHTEVAKQLAEAYGQFAKDREYGVTHTVVVVAAPHALMREMFWLPKSPAIVENPMFTLRVGAFAPSEIAAWIGNRKLAAQTQARLQEELLDEDLDLEGVSQGEIDEYLRSCEAYARGQARGACLSLCRMEPASALARARSPVELAKLIFQGPPKGRDIPRRGQEHTLLDILAKPELESDLVVASSTPFIGVGYAGDICRQLWVAQKRKAYREIRGTPREHLLHSDATHRSLLVELASMHPVVCTPLTPERVVLLFGAPLHLFAPMRVGIVFEIPDVLRSSLFAPHLPEPSRLRSSIDANDNATRKLLADTLPNAAVLTNNIDDALLKNFMTDPGYNQLPLEEMYLMRGLMESGEGIQSLQAEIAAAAAREPVETPEQAAQRELERMREITRAQKGRRR